MKLRKTLLISLEIILLSICLINIFNPNKKEKSEKEQRNLQQMPQFTFSEILQNTYFEKLNNYLTDRFIFRDNILNLQENINKYLLFSNYIKSDEEVSYIQINNNEEIISDVTNETESASIDENDEEADIETQKVESVTNGYLYYKDVLYSKVSTSLTAPKKFLSILEEYEKKFNKSKISYVPAPQSQLLLENNKKLKLNLINQKELINLAKDNAKGTITIVNSYDNLLKHSDEYIFFKYDHHWTNLGAYYAYEELCNCIGESPFPLSKMSKVLINSAWTGSCYAFTGDARFKGKNDEIYAYIPPQKNTMMFLDIYGNINNATTCIRPGFTSYSAFISGDNPYTVINVPENPQDKNVLVIKDSYGCAFVPFLVSNYGNIFVVDPRYADFNVAEMLKDIKIKDVIFVLAIYEPYNQKFIDNLKKIIK